MTFLQRTDRPTRIALVTAGLAATGGVVGGICAASAFSTIAVLSSGFATLVTAGTLGLLAIATGFGAVAGMVGAPLLGWGLLRSVPLGRVIVWTAVGTVVGSVAGNFLTAINPYPQLLPSVIAGGVLGFVLAGIGLHVHAGQTRATDIDRAT